MKLLNDKKPDVHFSHENKIESIGENRSVIDRAGDNPHPKPRHILGSGTFIKRHQIHSDSDKQDQSGAAKQVIRLGSDIQHAIANTAHYSDITKIFENGAWYMQPSHVDNPLAVKIYHSWPFVYADGITLTGEMHCDPRQQVNYLKLEMEALYVDPALLMQEPGTYVEQVDKDRALSATGYFRNNRQARVGFIYQNPALPYLNMIVVEKIPS